MQALTPILINMLFSRSGNTQAQANAENGQAQGHPDDIHGAGASHPDHHRRRHLQHAHRRHHSMGGDMATVASSASRHTQSPLSGEDMNEKRVHSGKVKRFSLDDRSSSSAMSEKPRQQRYEQPMSRDYAIQCSDLSRDSIMTDATATILPSSNQLRRRSSADKSKVSEAPLIDLS